MLESYRYKLAVSPLKGRYIVDFTTGKAKGSTGQPPWFQVKEEDQKKFLKGKVLEILYVFLS